MFKEITPFFIVAETPIHAGSGGDSTGLVDLPIQRERYTDFPKIEASSIKGCIREAFEGLEKTKACVEQVFGPEKETETYASAIAFTDARILLFPVKSLKNVFGWITCPMVLERMKEDFRLANKNYDELNIDFSKLENTVPKSSDLTIDGKAVLEEYTFEVKENDNTSRIANFIANIIFKDSYKFWSEKLRKDLIILSDDDFTNFVKTSTEIITRIKINDKTGTVDTGALWTEEYLPQDSVLYSLVMSSSLKVSEEDRAKCNFKSDTHDEAKRVMKFFKENCPSIIQIGGNQTIGKGLARIEIL
ncbi:MAG: type III-B CRISPR module RAMP protein Cmr4 [Hydrogenobaculum sp.]|nr:MAG: type III-B CRISPR module RAMP protein Cmr4 [Hydrogenobaculum sp.]